MIDLNNMNFICTIFMQQDSTVYNCKVNSNSVRDFPAETNYVLKLINFIGVNVEIGKSYVVWKASLNRETRVVDATFVTEVVSPLSMVSIKEELKDSFTSEGKLAKSLDTNGSLNTSLTLDVKNTDQITDPAIWPVSLDYT